jgi:hypothetical protein
MKAAWTACILAGFHRIERIFLDLWKIEYGTKETNSNTFAVFANGVWMNQIFNLKANAARQRRMPSLTNGNPITFQLRPVNPRP